MARRTITQIVDDLDGSQNAEEVLFSFGGTDYVIDLNKKNRAAFEKAMKPYVAAARKAPRSATKGRGRAAKSRDLTAVRAWAKEQGIEVSDRGRVPSHVIEQFDAAH